MFRIEFLGYLKAALYPGLKRVGWVIPFCYKAKGALLERQRNVLLAKSRKVGLKNPGRVGLYDACPVVGVTVL